MFTRGKLLEHWQEVLTLQKVYHNLKFCAFKDVWLDYENMKIFLIFLKTFSRHISNDGTCSKTCSSQLYPAEIKKRMGKYGDSINLARNNIIGIQTLE